VTIENRLKEERNRLGFNQPTFAALAGRTKKTMIDYEKGVSSPDAKFLAAIAEAGADVQYILTGKRGLAEKVVVPRTPISEQRAQKIVELYQALNEQGQQEILAAIEKEKRLTDQADEISQLRQARKVG
jgi:transcriptional regulator with XRE-family HTH domain